MELDAPQSARLPAQSVRFIEAQLSVVSARLRASRARPLDRDAIEELTELKFNETRLLRRLRLIAAAKSPLRDVLLLDPARELLNELNDARAEAVRRGALISLGLRQLDRVSRKISFVDALAGLVEDGIDAGANYLSLEIRQVTDNIVLRLTTDQALLTSSLGYSCLSDLHSVVMQQTPAGFTQISIGAAFVETHDSAHSTSARPGTKRWTAPRPSSI